jgi:hypothetical protein
MSIQLLRFKGSYFSVAAGWLPRGNPHHCGGYALTSNLLLICKGPFQKDNPAHRRVEYYSQLRWVLTFSSGYYLSFAVCYSKNLLFGG